MKISSWILGLSTSVLGFAMLPETLRQSPGKKVSYDRDIRPILSEHCFKCHGPDVEKAAAGLRLDSFAGATAKVVVPGHPKTSVLIARVSEKDPEDRMPPKDSGVKALTAEQIETLKKWIEQGGQYEKHWSFVTPEMPAIPNVKDASWVRNPVDNFVLSRMEAAGIKPESGADKNTLALRASQTLTGLPPTQAEFAAFANDNKPLAFERYVDRLMAKPEYGEHQARYWLDAVRYGDTHGLQLDNERAIYPYRDWVVRAFNSDLPYDKFVLWQLAGDLLPNPTTEQLIATGYVRMNLTTNEGGAIPEEFLARNTFDRVDTTSTALLGLTVACAKCHDHKYDPIKQADYYGLYAFFNSTEDEPLDGNIALPPPAIQAPLPEQEKTLIKMESRLSTLRGTVDPRTAAKWFRENHRLPEIAQKWELSPVYISSSFDKAFDEAQPGEPGQAEAKWNPLAFEIGQDVPGIIKKDSAFMYIRGKLQPKSSQKLAVRILSDDAVKVWLNGKLIHSNKTSRGLKDGSDLVQLELKAGENELIAKVVNGAGPDGFGMRYDDPIGERLASSQKLLAANPKDEKALNELKQVYLEAGPGSPSSTEFRKLLASKKQLESEIPMTLIARERKVARPTFILKRGEYDQKGAPVQRHVPASLGLLPTTSPKNRLGLAQWLTASNHPLFARVFVNRVWQQHFGTGIVKTVDDFGNQGDWPVDQPLLDYLAVRFVQDGWSVKKLNRMIVTSTAFRQRSRITPEKLAKDPENRLFARGPRFRLDAEVIRDKTLSSAGLLLQAVGGKGFKPYQPDGLWENSSDPASGTHFYVKDKGSEIYRRSLYMFWKRTSPPPLMAVFDAPLRDTCVVRRSTTDTPLQALAALNETAFLEASRLMAVRVLKTSVTDSKRISNAFEFALSRKPQPWESALIAKSLVRYRLRYEASLADAAKLLAVGDAPQSKEFSATEQAAWMIVCSSLMNTDEFLTQH